MEKSKKNIAHEQKMLQLAERMHQAENIQILQSCNNTQYTKSLCIEKQQQRASAESDQGLVCLKQVVLAISSKESQLSFEGRGNINPAPFLSSHCIT